MFYEDVETNKVYRSILSKVISGTEIDMAAQLSGLDHPNFLDPEVGKSYGFKDRVVPGAHVLACMLGLLYRAGFLTVALWAGAKDISFKMPVFPGDALSAEWEVLEKKDSRRGGGMVTYCWRLFNQDQQLVAEGTNL